MRLSKIRKNWREILLLLAVLVLAAFLRFYKLGKVPVSPDWDEAALGYNAYSILKTGCDEYGERFPLFLRSFGDYKPAAYVYLAILPIKFLGLNVLATRLPAALLGTLAVLAVYFLVKEVFRNSQLDNLKICNLPFVAAFLLAISPWHLQFSRIAFESNIGVFINILLALFFLKGLKKPWFLSLAAFLAGLNIYTYQAEKIFTPCLVLSLILIWRRQLLKMPRRFLAIAVFIGLVVSLPFIHKALTTPEIFLRAKGTSFASDQTLFLARTVEKLARDKQKKDFLGLVLDNRRVTYVVAFVNSYLSHFDFNWLFIRGDDVRHHAPGMGLLYLWELPFFLLGIYKLVFNKKNSKIKSLLFAWFFLAPLPAAFTSGTPHAVRTLRFLPVVQVFTSLGLISFWKMMEKRLKLRALISFSLAVFFVFNFTYFFNQYFSQLNYFTSWAWQYGYEPAIKKIQKIESQYEKIIVSNQAPLDQSYIFFLFYLSYDPAAYQNEGQVVSSDLVGEEKAFGKYYFRPIKWPEEKKGSHILYIGRPNDFIEGETEILEEIEFIGGQPSIKIVEG